MWNKINQLWDKFETSSIGKYILRKKSYIGVVSFFAMLTVTQLALFNSKNCKPPLKPNYLKRNNSVLNCTFPNIQ